VLLEERVPSSASPSASLRGDAGRLPEIWNRSAWARPHGVRARRAGEAGVDSSAPRGGSGRPSRTFDRDAEPALIGTPGAGATGRRRRARAGDRRRRSSLTSAVSRRRPRGPAPSPWHAFLLPGGGNQRSRTGPQLRDGARRFHRDPRAPSPRRAARGHREPVHAGDCPGEPLAPLPGQNALTREIANGRRPKRRDSSLLSLWAGQGRPLLREEARPRARWPDPPRGRGGARDGLISEDMITSLHRSHPCLFAAPVKRRRHQLKT